LSCLTYCCGRRRFLLRHCATDWLLGTWFVYWSTLFSVVAFGIFTLYYLAKGASDVATFANICT
jgi:hypothetical protein